MLDCGVVPCRVCKIIGALCCTSSNLPVFPHNRNPAVVTKLSEAHFASKIDFNPRDSQVPNTVGDFGGSADFNPRDLKEML